MVFIPSIGGVSHDFAENSHDDDIVLGCQVLADAAVTILREARTSAWHRIDGDGADADGGR